MNGKSDDYQAQRNEERWAPVDKKIDWRNGIFDDDEKDMDPYLRNRGKTEDMRLLAPQLTDKRISSVNQENLLLKSPFLWVMVVLVVIGLGMLLYFKVLVNIF